MEVLEREEILTGPHTLNISTTPSPVIISTNTNSSPPTPNINILPPTSPSMSTPGLITSTNLRARSGTPNSSSTHPMLDEEETEIQSIVGSPTSINALNSLIQSKQPPFDITDFECSLCFRLFCRPVSTPCGHTYCRNCLIAAMKYNHNCPLCRAKIDPSKQKFSVNIVLLNVIEKYFKEEYLEREKEEDEEEEMIADTPSEKSTTNSDSNENDYYTPWSYCLPPMRETCFVLLSCAD